MKFDKRGFSFGNLLDKYVPKFAAEVKLNLPNVSTNITLPKLKQTEKMESLNG